eukprot:1911714-Rhodomonas_salina.1
MPWLPSRQYLSTESSPPPPPEPSPYQPHKRMSTRGPEPPIQETTFPVQGALEMWFLVLGRCPTSAHLLSHHRLLTRLLVVAREDERRGGLPRLRTAPAQRAR